MARNKGTFEFAANFEVLAKAPLDARTTVETLADLFRPETWQDGDSNIWLYNGMVVKVVSDNTNASGIYVLTDADNYDKFDAWKCIERFEVEATSTIKLTYYIDTPANGGSDEFGDGSQAHPFATIKRMLLSLLPQKTSGKTTSVYLGNGEFLLRKDEYEYLKFVSTSVNIKIIGSYSLFTDGLTAQRNSEYDYYWDILVNGEVPDWEDNELIGKLVSHPSFNPNPVYRNEGNKVAFARSYGDYAPSYITELYNMDTTIRLVDGKIPSPVAKNSAITITYCCLIVKSDESKIRGITNFSGEKYGQTKFSSCVLDFRGLNPDIRIYGGSGTSVRFEYSLLIGDFSKPMLLFTSKFYVNLGMVNTTPSANNEGAIKIFGTVNTAVSIMQPFFYGFKHVFIIDGFAMFYMRYGHYRFAAENIGALFFAKGGGFEFNTGTNYGQHRLRIHNVDYIFTGYKNTGVKLYFNFGENIIVEEPTKGYLVPKAGDTWNGLSIPGCTFDEFVVPQKHIFIKTPDIFPEIETGVKVADIPVNTQTTNQIGNTTQNKSIKLDYQLTRGNETRFGVLEVINVDDTNVQYNDAYQETNDIGVNLSVQIDGQAINLALDVDNSTTDTVDLKYNASRIMKDL